MIVIPDAMAAYLYIRHLRPRSFLNPGSRHTDIRLTFYQTAIRNQDNNVYLMELPAEHPVIGNLSVAVLPAEKIKDNGKGYA